MHDQHTRLQKAIMLLFAVECSHLKLTAYKSFISPSALLQQRRPNCAIAFLTVSGVQSQILHPGFYLWRTNLALLRAQLVPLHLLCSEAAHRNAASKMNSAGSEDVNSSLQVSHGEGLYR